MEISKKDNHQLQDTRFWEVCAEGGAATSWTRKEAWGWCLETNLFSSSVQVLFWCLNEESDFEVAFSLGANGVMTDYPTALRHYLDKQEEETQPPQPEALSCLSLKK